MAIEIDLGEQVSKREVRNVVVSIARLMHGSQNRLSVLSKMSSVGCRMQIGCAGYLIVSDRI